MPTALLVYPDRGNFVGFVGNIPHGQRTDTADRPDYPRMTRLVLGLVTMVEELAGPPTGG